MYLSFVLLFMYIMNGWCFVLLLQESLLTKLMKAKIDFYGDESEGCTVFFHALFSGLRTINKINLKSNGIRTTIMAWPASNKGSTICVLWVICYYNKNKLWWIVFETQIILQNNTGWCSFHNTRIHILMMTFFFFLNLLKRGLHFTPLISLYSA